MFDPSQEWSDYEEKYRPIYQSFFHFLEHDPLFQPTEILTSEESLATLSFLTRYDLSRLCKEYSLRVSRDEHFPDLILLTSDRLYSPEGFTITRECWEGLVVSESNWQLVSWTFPQWKSFNPHLQYNHLQWERMRITEKLDGLLVTLFHWKGEWLLHSNDVLQESHSLYRPFYSRTSFSPFRTSPETFSGHKSLPQIFWSLWGDNLRPSETHLTFSFQLLDSNHSLIVQHAQSKLVLIAVHNISSMKEEDPLPLAQRYNLHVPQSVQADSLSILVDKSITLNPVHSAGFICCDDRWERLTVESPQWNALRTLTRENQSAWKADRNTNERLVVEIIRTNSHLDFLSVFPEWKEYFEELKEQYYNFLDIVVDTYHKLTKIEDPKVYAKEAKKFPFYGHLFEWKADGVAVDNKFAFSFFAKIQLKRVISLMKKTLQATV